MVGGRLVGALGQKPVDSDGGGDGQVGLGAASFRLWDGSFNLVATVIFAAVAWRREFRNTSAWPHGNASTIHLLLLQLRPSEGRGQSIKANEFKSKIEFLAKYASGALAVAVAMAVALTLLLAVGCWH